MTGLATLFLAWSLIFGVGAALHAIRLERRVKRLEDMAGIKRPSEED